MSCECKMTPLFPEGAACCFLKVDALQHLRGCFAREVLVWLHFLSLGWGESSGLVFRFRFWFASSKLRAQGQKVNREVDEHTAGMLKPTA